MIGSTNSALGEVSYFDITLLSSWHTGLSTSHPVNCHTYAKAGVWVSDGNRTFFLLSLWHFLNSLDSEMQRWWELWMWEISTTSWRQNCNVTERHGRCDCSHKVQSVSVHSSCNRKWGNNKVTTFLVHFVILSYLYRRFTPIKAPWLDWLDRRGDDSYIRHITTHLFLYFCCTFSK